MPVPAPAPVAKIEDATIDNKSSTNAAQPLAPPPKPGQAQANSDGPDYFSGNHNQAHFSREPNPFEQSFGNPSTETPGRFPGLPSVASLTSPAPLGAAATPGWQLGNSLRSGPLSPAMLTGPANASSYFDDGFRQSFPTPNESSLRTGLTPGGGGSMFPAPSPGTSAMFNSMSNNGLATPGTIDFHRTAINAAARSKVDNNNMQTQQSAQAPIAPKQEFPQQSQSSALNSDPFNNHPDRDAVNSLYMLAQTGNRNANQFAVPPPPQSMRSGMQLQDTSPTTARGRPSNVGTDGSHSGDDDKGSGKGRKKSSAGKGSTVTNARRKADDLMPKQPAAKRMKGGNNMGMMPQDMDDDEMFDEDDIKGEMSDIGPNGKKMTDEEKRKNFLERNRYVRTIYVTRSQTANHGIVSLHSNVVSARSNGLPIYKPRSRYSLPRTMHSTRRTVNCETRL